MNQELINKILIYIEQHIHEKISLADLAHLAGYSPFYFSTLFAETMGISVTSYIRVRKLQHAMADILSYEKITDVAFKYSFESHEGFTRSFTKLFGSSPSTIRKHITSYTIPDYIVPNIIQRKENNDMKTQNSLKEEMAKIPLTFLSESLKEWEAGYCTQIKMELLADNTIRIQDNGRGIPLSNNSEINQEILQHILSGQPITPLEYQHMEPLPNLTLQIANSLCEKLQLNVYRNGNKYIQDYVRGIPQHDIIRQKSDCPSGMEIFLKPDTEIFGELTFEESSVTISKNK